MTSAATASSLSTVISERDQHKRVRFVLLAKVGHQKRELSQLRDGMDFFYTLAIEQAALLAELLTSLESAEKDNPQLSEQLVTLVSRHTSLLKATLNYWPEDTTSREALQHLLESESVQKVLDFSPEGYASPSMDRMLKNVARAIAVTTPSPA